MVTCATADRSWWSNRFVTLFLILILLAGLLGPATTPRAEAGVLQTVGDFLSLGANTIRELQEAIRLAGGEMRLTLQQFHDDLTSLLDTLQKTYQNNLNVTISTLDDFTRNKFLELEALITQVNEALQADILLASQEAQNVVRTAARELRETARALEESLKNVIVTGGETVAYVLDLAAFYTIGIIVLVALALGLLLFVFLLFTRRIPEGLPGALLLLLMAAYLALNGALLFPPIRVAAMTFTGVGLEDRLDKINQEPRIFEVIPQTVKLGETREVEIWGARLLLDNRVPVAKIGDKTISVRASSNERVVLDVATLNVPDGSANLSLEYADGLSLRQVIKIERPVPAPLPPDLTITGFQVTPASPVVGGNVRADITVRNGGAGPAGPFSVRWQPFPQSSGKSGKINGLGPGQSQAISFDATYANANTFDSVATADSLGEVAETNEANNSVTRRVTVQPAPPRRARVEVYFSQITVQDDADPAGSGELWLDFNVSGATGRWPGSGTADVESGNTYNIGRRFTVTLTEGQDLTIFVNGTDEDSPGFPLYDNHDPMGTVPRTYHSDSEWGKGSYSEQSTCEDGCYTIHYTISVTWLP